LVNSRIKRYLLYGGFKDIHVAQNDTPYLVLEGHRSDVLSMIELLDSRFASSSVDNSIIIWSYINFSQVNKIDNCHTDWTRSLLAHNNVLLSGSDDCSIKVWNLSKFKMTYHKVQTHDDGVNQLIGYKDLIISCGGDGFITSWILNNDNSLTNDWQLKDDSIVWSICLVNEDILVAGLGNNNLTLWD